MLGSVVGRVIKCGLGWCVLSRIEPLQSYHPDSKSHQLQADIESLPAVGIVLYSTIRNMAITFMQTICADQCTPHTLGLLLPQG